MRRLTPLLLIPLALAFTACGGSASGSDPGGSGGNGGSGGSAANGGNGGGGGGEPCGDTVCPSGTYCCNASCGTCVEPGEGCTAIACGNGGSAGGGGQAGGGNGGAGNGGGGNGGGGNGGAGGASLQCGNETCQAGQQCCGTECGGGFCADGELPCPPVDCQPELCGQVYCEQGTYCCNPSCNTCVGPGEGCTDEACEPDCTPMRAQGHGDCDAFFGWAWTGTYCTAIGGCQCEGPDCGSLFFTEGDCLKAYGMCPIPF